MEQKMVKPTYTQFETKHGAVSVILEFPYKSDNEEKVHEEIRQILSNLLLEQMTQLNQEVMKKGICQ